MREDLPAEESQGVTPGEPAYPSAITAAGPQACAAWDQLTTGGAYRVSTRGFYRTVALRFLRWVEQKGTGLTQVTPRLAEEFLHGLDVQASSRSMYRTALRWFFDALASRGVIPCNPADEARLSAEEPEAGRQGQSPRNAPPTLAELREYVHELALDPIEEGEEDFEAALVLLAALYLGSKKIMPLSRLTGVRPRRVAEFADTLRANGVWTVDGKTAAQWFDDDGGQLAFWLDVWVATGMMERASADGPSNQDKIYEKSPM